MVYKLKENTQKMNDESKMQKEKTVKIDENTQSLSTPSSFQINPQYFNHRLVRIKGKIDVLMKQLIPTETTSLNSQFIIDDKRISHETAQTNYTTIRKKASSIEVEKIVGETKDKIQSIYNQIHLLESVAVRDQNVVETNTFQLRSFLKDLRNQNKRLNKIIPENVLFQIQQQKSLPFKKSTFAPKQINPESSIAQDKTKKQQDLLLAKQLIEAELNRKTFKKDSQKYYDDVKHNSKCNLFTCQLM